MEIEYFPLRSRRGVALWDSEWNNTRQLCVNDMLFRVFMERHELRAYPVFTIKTKHCGYWTPWWYAAACANNTPRATTKTNARVVLAMRPYTCHLGMGASSGGWKTASHYKMVENGIMPKCAANRQLHFNCVFVNNMPIIDRQTNTRRKYGGIVK